MPDTLHPHRKRGLFARLRSSFLTGLVVVLPIGLTIYLIWTFIGWIDSWVLPLVPGPWKPESILRDLLGSETAYSVRGVGVIVFLIFTVIVGWVAKGLIGRSVLRITEGVVDRTPVVRSVYNGLKQIAETVFAQSETNFEGPCLVQFPRAGVWAIGFISTKARGEVARHLADHDEVLTIFVPTTPNPTSGFLVFVPARDIIRLEMTLEEAAKMIISAGLVYPNPKDPSKPLPNAA